MGPHVIAACLVASVLGGRAVDSVLELDHSVVWLPASISGGNHSKVGDVHLVETSFQRTDALELSPSSRCWRADMTHGAGGSPWAVSVCDFQRPNKGASGNLQGDRRCRWRVSHVTIAIEY